MEWVLYLVAGHHNMKIAGFLGGFRDFLKKQQGNHWTQVKVAKDNQLKELEFMIIYENGITF